MIYAYRSVHFGAAHQTENSVPAEDDADARAGARPWNFMIPLAVMIVTALYAYATGCFRDMAAIVIPIAIPLSNARGIDPILTSSAVFSGAAFGSNTCLYGDGVIMCSQGCRVEPLDLMRTTLPYAGIAGAAAFIPYLIVGFI